MKMIKTLVIFFLCITISFTIGNQKRRYHKEQLEINERKSLRNNYEDREINNKWNNFGEYSF